ncbi:unnamed protein product [Malus baccata var. baccata]
MIIDVIFVNKLSKPCLLENNSLNESVENLRENNVGEESQNIVGESHDDEICGYVEKDVNDESHDQENGGDLEENVGDESQDHENGGDVDLNVVDDHFGVEENIESLEPIFHLNIYDPILAKDGNSDWRHLGEKLDQYEKSKEYLINSRTWVELKSRLTKNQTIDKEFQMQIKKEPNHWKQVMLRIIDVMKCLAIRNLAFRGTNERLYEDSNGNFLGLLEMNAEFDPIMQ